MKKLFLVLIGMAVLTACRKELLPNFSSDISDEILAEARSFHKKETSSASSTSKTTTVKGAPETMTPVRIKLLEPLWDEMRESTLTDGTQVLIVPSPDFKISNDKYSVLREFVFTISNGHIVDGKIVEFYGAVEFIDKSKESLTRQYKSKTITGYEGPVIQYDLKYRYLSGIHYEDGKQTDINVSIMVKAKTEVTSPTKTAGVSTKTSPGATTKSETCYVWDFYTVSSTTIAGFTYFEYSWIYSFMECYPGAPPGSYGGGGTSTSCSTCQTYCQVTCGSKYGVNVANANITFESNTAACTLGYMAGTMWAWATAIPGVHSAITNYHRGVWAWSQLEYWFWSAAATTEFIAALALTVEVPGVQSCYQSELSTFNAYQASALTALDGCYNTCP